jgi:DNA-binding transcriptional LysR family regulator
VSFEDLRAFLSVVEQGSFFAAANALGVSRTTLRRQVDSLEARAGVPLLQRHRKGVELTAAGKQLVLRGRVMEQEFTGLLRAIREDGQKPAGLLRLMMPVGIQPMALTAMAGVLRQSWPEVHVVVRFSEAPLTASLADVDLVVWFGAAEPSRAWESRTLLEMPQRLVATPSYLAARGTPRSIAELRGHEIFAWLRPGENEARLVTARGDEIPLEPSFASANANLLHECAHAGLGIAWVPDAGLPTPPNREPLVVVLEGEVTCPTALKIAVPRTLAEVPKVRVILDNIQQLLAMAGTAKRG